MLIKIKNTLVLIFVMLASLNCSAQESETYWEIKTIHREDNTPFKGLTGDIMQGILDYNFHFIRRGDSLHFDLPSKFSFALAEFKNLSQLQIRNKDYYQMYEQSFDGDVFKVKFKDLATMTDAKNTILEFVRISKAQYDDHIKEEIAYQKTIAEKINALRLQLTSNPQILLAPLEKLPQKSQTIEDDKGKGISLMIPKEIDLKKSGQIKTAQFGAVKIGTLVKNSVVYDIEYPKKDYGLKQLAIWVSTDPASFDLNAWKKQNPNHLIFKEDNNGLIGYELDYDADQQKAIIRSFFCLKYKKAGKTHVFLYSDIFRAQFRGDYDPLKDMNETLNFNYLMLNNISI